MKYSILIFAFIGTFSLFSCSPGSKKMSDEISKMESDMETTQKIDSLSVTELLSAYQNFSSKYPADSLAPEYLYRAAGLAIGFNRGEQAVEIYESIIHNFPYYKKLPDCYFMEAFAYENTIGNIGKAFEYYNLFLAKYPHHELADDALASIKFLGKSPEEMVREFDKLSADSVNVVNR